MISILIVENRRRGEEAMLRALALAETFQDKSLVDRNIEVEILENVTAAKKKMQKERVHAVIFLTKSMEITLKKLAKDHPGIKFFVLTDHIPEGKVIWIEREWFSAELLRALIGTMDS